MFVTKKELEGLRATILALRLEMNVLAGAREGELKELKEGVEKLESQARDQRWRTEGIGRDLVGTRVVKLFPGGLSRDQSYNRVLDTEARVDAILDHLNLEAFDLPAEPPKTVLRKREKK